MRRRTVWSAKSRQDLEAIEAFWSDTRPGYAADVIARAADAMRLLAEHPGIGAPMDAGGVRKVRLRSTPYLLFYVFDADVVRAVRIRHQREDWRGFP